MLDNNDNIVIGGDDVVFVLMRVRAAGNDKMNIRHGTVININESKNRLVVKYENGIIELRPGWVLKI